jgi:BirA family biotin operon repressor/biotin-[acetyl-CoA-carboxylase] ligase
VYASVGSTQDAAHRHRRPGTGVAVVASAQTAGRGRLGRKWDDGDAATLPVSFALPWTGTDVGLAARAGLAALDTCRGAAPDADARIKWPNDVVVSLPDGPAKLAGVLVERRGDAAVVGVGINVFGPARSEAGYRAATLESLGGTTDRCGLAIRLIGAMSRWLAADDDAVRAFWAEHDAMIGTHRVFVVGGERVKGEVVGVDPLSVIRLRTMAGDVAVAVGRAVTEPEGDESRSSTLGRDSGL